MNDPQSRDIDWFSEWEDIQLSDQRHCEVVGSDDAERRLWVIKMLDAEAKELEAHYNNELARLEDWKEKEGAKLQRQRSWLERGLRAFLEGADKQSITLINGKLSIRKGRERIVVEDEAAFVMSMQETEFVSERFLHKPDKKAILAHIKATGEIPEGVDLVVSDDSFTVTTS
jgi:hypothetical protein|tara:strand:- start:158 stop:673 length:516 start_codon:yes stop_codon:yes gene_type:complete